MTISFIGGGNMTRALIGGLLKQNSPAGMRVVEIDAEQRDRIRLEFNLEVYAELDKGVAGSDTVVLAVKPQQLSAVARELAPLLSGHLVISIAAGIRAADISRWLGDYSKIVRAMPNTPALAGSGITGLHALPAVDEKGKLDAETLFAGVGSVLWCPHEEMLDVVTAVAGSGPAYVFYFMEAMQKAAVELGQTAAQARQLTIETFLGAVRLTIQSNEDASILRARVTSPGGTTERAIRSFEADGVQNAIVKAIHLAHERSQELGDEFGKT
ncbi:MAG TPA: pyrroline-5-carboxylate reductase [Nitrosospira sp.]|nr:pyrroline-5-carboxylate reductase [Nitrosospira sp.]